MKLRNITKRERALLRAFPDETITARRITNDQAAILNAIICELKYGPRNGLGGIPRRRVMTAAQAARHNGPVMLTSAGFEAF